MIVINCTVEKNIPIKTVIDSGIDINCISQKHIDKLKITYHDKSNSIETLDASYFVLGKVNLCITFNDGKKHKSISSEFIVIGSDWPNHFPDLTLGMSWLQKNGITLDIYNSKILLDDNFAIPIKEVK